MLISIIMPVYNAEGKVEKTLQSIVAQDKNLYELIILDNESTDKTAYIISQYIDNYPVNIHLYSAKDRGIYDAMNKGIGLSTGDYLYFIGAGDCLTPGSLEQVAIHGMDCPDIIYGDVLMYPEGYVLGKEFAKADVLSGFLCHQQIFYNRNIFERFGGYNLSYPVFADAHLNVLCWSDASVRKKYIRTLVATYEGNGFSVVSTRENYTRELRKIIIHNYGYEDYMKYYACTGQEFILISKYIPDLRYIIVAREWMISTINRRIEEMNKKHANHSIIIDVITVVDLKDIYCKDDKHVDFFIICGNSIYDELLIKISLMKQQIHEDKILIGRGSVIAPDIIDFAEKNSNRSIIIFGTGKAAEDMARYMLNHDNHHQIGCFFDNNKEKEGIEFMGRLVYKPRIDRINEDTYIIVASMWRKEITEQLQSMGVLESKIVF